MRPTPTASLLAGACLWLTAFATPPHGGHDATGSASAPSPPRDMETMWREMLAKPSLAVTATFDERGRLWTVIVQGQHLLVRRSDDRGVSWSVPVRVNAEPERVLGDGENRPKIIARNGRVYVSWTQGLAKPMTGDIRFARSADDGRTFSAPVTVNDNREVISHRFDAMALDGRGRVVIAWLDKRDQQAARTKGEPYAGAALYHAVSGDGGASFEANRKIADHSCECCRVAMALDTDGVPVVFWRQIFGKNVRDHALMRLDGASPMRRVSRDDWKVDACPHHGPAIAIASDGTYHLAWFSGAPANPGLFYARSGNRGRTVSTPLRFGDPDAQPAHPQVLAIGRRVYLAWKEFDGRASVVRVMVSHDGGRHWSKPWSLASAASASDHPILVGDGKTAYLSWNALTEGYRLIAIPDDPARP